MNDLLTALASLSGWFIQSFRAQPVVWIVILAGAVYGRMAIKRDVDKKDAITFGGFMALCIFAMNRHRPDDIVTPLLGVMLLVMAFVLALPMPFPESKWIDLAPGSGAPMHRITGRRAGGFYTHMQESSLQEFTGWTVRVDHERNWFLIWFVVAVFFIVIMPSTVIFPLVPMLLALWFFARYCWWEFCRILYWPHYGKDAAPAPADDTARQQTQRQRLGGRRDLD